MECGDATVSVYSNISNVLNHIKGAAQPHHYTMCEPQKNFTPRRRHREPHEEARLIWLNSRKFFAKTLLLRLAGTLALHVQVLKHVR